MIKNKIINCDFVEKLKKEIERLNKKLYEDCGDCRIAVVEKENEELKQKLQHSSYCDVVKTNYIQQESIINKQQLEIEELKREVERFQILFNVGKIRIFDVQFRNGNLKYPISIELACDEKGLELLRKIEEK